MAIPRERPTRVTGSGRAAAIARRLEAADIRRFAVPTPFSVGDVNAYLVDGDPPTLIDSGPNSATSYLSLLRQLAVGRRAADIGLLLVTHQHVDHLGLTPMLVQESGADVACLDLLSAYVKSFEDSLAHDDDAAASLMLRHGVDPNLVAAVRAHARVLGHWGAPFHADQELRDGDTVTSGSRAWRVIHAPGHSPSDTLFLEQDRGILFTGDHLRANISSNALVGSTPLRRSHHGPELRPRALIDYIESLERTKRLEVDLVLGGHGEPIENHRALIDKRLAEHEERAEHILALLNRQARTAHELSIEMWGVATESAGEVVRYFPV